MTDPLIEVLPIEQAATPDPNNINRHTARGGALVVNSLQRRGAFRSIASAGKDAQTPVVYAGNLTLEKAVEAGFTEVVNVHVTGNQLVNVVRDDVAPGSPEAIALGLEDNESGKQSYNPDIDILAQLAAGDDAILSALRKEDKTLNRMIEGIFPIDPMKEWEGMPEFEQEDLSAFATIIVRFDSKENLDKFSEIIGQTITDKTKHIWYPKKEKQDLDSMAWKDES